MMNCLGWKKRETNLRRSMGKVGKECETETANGKALNGGVDWDK